MKQEMHRLGVWVMVQRAPDVPGEWVAHCLDYDVISQGTSLLHAFQMIVEALGMYLEDDIKAGVLPPKRSAPQKYWNQLWSIIQGGTACEGIPADLPQDTWVAGHILLEITLSVEEEEIIGDWQSTVRSWAPSAELGC